MTINKELYILVYWCERVEQYDALPFSTWTEAMEYYDQTNGTAVSGAYFNGRTMKEFDADANWHDYKNLQQQNMHDGYPELQYGRTC